MAESLAQEARDKYANISDRDSTKSLYADTTSAIMTGVL